MPNLELIAQYAQQEYGLAYGLVFALVFLGLLVVCIPRPRKKELIVEPKKQAARGKGGAKGRGKRGKKKKEIPMSAFGNMAFGALLGAGGIIATVVSYNMAGPTGEYSIWYGPVIWGVIHFIIGIVQIFKR
ncbi:MAG: hypothetical protein AAF456_01095 [Planctomycetota bacterium]